jgi:1,4-dihydroxy-2-naphthoate octaprenyltransferase
MNVIQKTAIKETAKIIGAITGLVVVISVIISLLSWQSIATLAVIYLLCMAVKMIYDTQLLQAQVKQTEIDAEIDRLHK